MRYHLEKHHLSEYTQASHEADDTESSHSSVPPAKRTKATKSSPEQTITSSFKMTPLPQTSERYKTLTKAVCYFICKDQQPFDTVNDIGFRHMLHVFESQYTTPDRITIASKYVPTMYVSLKQDITKQLKDADYYCITTDMWSSQAKQSYIAVTSNHITSVSLRNSFASSKLDLMSKEPVR